VRTIKTVGSQFYAGTTLSLNVPIDFSTSESIAIKTWSPKNNIPVRLKLENVNGSQFLELDVNTTVDNQWEELVWDFSGMTGGIDFTKVIVFFEFIESLPGDGSTYYFDDINVVGSLGLNDNDSLSVTAFPNPVKNVWNVQAMEEILEITMYNTIGQRVLNASPNSTTYSADLSSLETGMYLVQIVSSAGISTKRILKQ
jgi:hypothetical protein